MNIIQRYEAEQIARLTADPRGARLRARRHGARRGEGGGGRAHPHPGLRRRVHRALQQGAEQQLHRAQDQLRRGRGARVPALFAADRRDRRGAPRRRAARQAVLPARPVAASRARIAERARARSPGSGAAEAQAGHRTRPDRRRVKGRHAMSDSEAAHAVRQDLGQPRRGAAPGRHLHPLHRPPSGARGHQPAGVRGPAPGRPQAAPPGLHDRGRRPQHPDRRLARARATSRKRTAASRSRRWRRTSSSSACRTSRSSMCARASCTSSARSWAFSLPGTTIVCGD